MDNNAIGAAFMDADAEENARERLIKRARAIVSLIAYKDGWRFRIGDGWLQVEFDARDADVSAESGYGSSIQRGRKWLLSVHMTDSEIVQTAFRAVLGAEEHECRETFKLNGVAVLGPHLDLFVLAESNTPLDARA